MTPERAVPPAAWECWGWRLVRFNQLYPLVLMTSFTGIP